MKKLLLTFILATTLVACGGKPDDKDKDKEELSEQALEQGGIPDDIAAEMEEDAAIASEAPPVTAEAEDEVVIEADPDAASADQAPEESVGEAVEEQKSPMEMVAEQAMEQPAESVVEAAKSQTAQSQETAPADQ